MKEDFLHYLWKFKKFQFLKAKTTAGEHLEILNSGWHNTEKSGPDFFNSKIKIGDQLWAGNVEIHIKSSDWYAHHHEKDSAYDNVILHVVWEHDVAVFRKDNSEIATLQLKNFVAAHTLKNYKELMSASQKWINCEADFANIDDFLLKNWMERLYIERLEEKAKLIYALLDASENDWEAVLFQLLAKNFGLNRNGEAFLAMARITPFSVIRKINEVEVLEALFFGQVNLLRKEIDDAYFFQLQKEYHYLQHKFQLQPSLEEAQFFRLRPPNFPTIRLSQLAQLFIQQKNLFSKIKSTERLEDFYELFRVETSAYWKTHYSFGKESKATSKKLSDKFIDLLIVNTIVPLKFAYQKSLGKVEVESIFNLLSSIPAEDNSILKKFNQLRKNTAVNAFESQALLQLKPNYCDQNKCLQCEIGANLLQRNPA
ncbi:MAG: DUF2851 family protein [Mesonia sp.]|uniref:DUF2851 family protein n=1 Tax=Mesonia sp. TaxID=1960830 RepID=UPI003241BE19